MKKVLFISGGETITKMFVNVIKELRDPVYEILVINRDYYFKENSSKILRDNDIATKGIETYKTRDVRKILKSEKPNVVIVAHDGEAIERSFISASKSLGIPTLLVQDGIVNLPKNLSPKGFISKVLYVLPYLLRRLRIITQAYLFLVCTCGVSSFSKEVLLWSKRSHGYGRGECNKVAAMGSYAKQVFVKLGFNAEDVVITGQPRFDELIYPKFTKHEVYKKINLSYDKDMVLLATPTFTDMEKRRRFVKAVIEAIKSFSKLVLVIKLHPGEHIESYEEILKEAKFSRARVIKDFDVPSLVRACKIFISDYSTMALEALIGCKPVIILNIFNAPEYYPFVTSGAALGVYKAEDLLGAIEKFLNDKTIKKRWRIYRNRFVYEHAYKIDGRASKRVANLIKQICK